MRFLLSALILASAIVSPLVALAQAKDEQVEATISAIDPAGESLSLDDGNTYRLPGEFNLEGLSEGTRVYVYYREENGTREVFDLEVVN
jgi:hypothetical protein